MFESFEKAKQYVEKNNIRMIDLKWSDYFGSWHHITVSAQYFTAAMMKDGIGFDGSSVGFKPVNAGDMVLIPDLSTGYLDPFFEDTTMSFLCDIHEADTKQQFSLDPREFVRKAEKYLQETGVADRSLWGPEYEFFIFDEVWYNNRLNSSGYYVNSYEATWEENENSNGYLVPKTGGYHRIPPSDQNNALRNKISIALEDIGYPVKYHHHEAGGPGHGEIEPPMSDITQSTDGAMVIKYLAKNFAHQYGKTLTFMPKPLFGEAGNGMHVHQLLMREGKNIFYDPDGYSQLSPTALYYIGGILSHACALCALTNPSTNSYKRLTPGFEAPVNCFFGKGDRSAAIRVPKYATDPSEVRIEYRTPDATCNPYIAIPAMLLAGLDGIINKIEPGENNFGPFEDDISELPEVERSKILSMPLTLDGSLDALEKDHEFLTKSGVFSEEFIDLWVAMKRKECADVYYRPHPIEIEKYLDC
jgi:glutamine synthetase